MRITFHVQIYRQITCLCTSVHLHIVTLLVTILTERNFERLILLRASLFEVIHNFGCSSCKFWLFHFWQTEVERAKLCLCSMHFSLFIAVSVEL